MRSHASTRDFPREQYRRATSEDNFVTRRQPHTTHRRVIADIPSNRSEGSAVSLLKKRNLRDGKHQIRTRQTRIVTGWKYMASAGVSGGIGVEVCDQACGRPLVAQMPLCASLTHLVDRYFSGAAFRAIPWSSRRQSTPGKLGFYEHHIIDNMPGRHYCMSEIALFPRKKALVLPPSTHGLHWTMHRISSESRRCEMG